MTTGVSLTSVDDLADELDRASGKAGVGRAVVVGIAADEPNGTKLVAEWGVREAQARGVPLHMVSAYHAKVSHEDSNPFDDELRDAAQHAVNDAVAIASAVAPGSAVSGEVVSGEPVEVLRRIGAHAGLVVVGARRLPAIDRTILGSVGTSVAFAAPSPTVVVLGPPGDDPDSRRVVAGVTLGDDTQPVLDFAFAYGQRHRLPVRPVHVRRSASRDFSVAMVESVGAEHDLEVAVKRIQERYPDVEVQPTLRIHHVVDALLAESASSDLLVMGRREPLAHPGLHPLAVALRVLHHANCPVSIVPYPSNPSSESTA